MFFVSSIEEPNEEQLHPFTKPVMLVRAKLVPQDLFFLVIYDNFQN